MIDAVIKDLNEVANPSRRKTLMKQGASESAIGVPLGFLRTYAKGLSGHPSLATELWKTQIVDAQLLAVMIMDANALSIDAIMDMIQEASTDALLDDFIFRTLVSYQDKEGLKQALLSKDEDVFGKVYWGLVVFELKKKTS